MPWLVIFQNLLSHKLRTLLTVGSMTIAVFLVCFLRTVLVSFEAGVAHSSSSRLMVQSSTSLYVDLPLAYQSKIETVPGVEGVNKMQWFGGYYKEPSNFFAQFAVDAEKLQETYPELNLLKGNWKDFTSNRTACLIGHVLADNYGFKVGDRVPIIGTFFTRNDGKPWEFTVAGIYKSEKANVDSNTLWFHYKYLQESLESKQAEGPPGVGVYALRVKPGADVVAISAAVDKMFDGGPLRTLTTTEGEFNRQFLSMMGNVPFFLTSIGGGVLFSLVLAVLNTMLLSFRQRFHEIGVLKALGFTDSVTFGMLLFESLLICGIGGLIGIGVVLGTAPMLGQAMASMIPLFLIEKQTLAMGMGVALATGLFAGLFPAIQAQRLQCIEALRAEV